MKIEVSRADLLTLRREVAERLRNLKKTPAAKSDDPQFRAAVDPQIAVLTKFVRRMNTACVKMYGHDCCASSLE